MILEAKRHQKSYERQSCMLQNTKQGRDNVFGGKIEKKNLVSLMCFEVKKQKAKKD